MFHGKDVRFDPFGGVGYSVQFRGDTVNMFHYGGGFNYWAGKDLALRLELRDRLYRTPVPGHLWTFRIGVAFTHLFP